MHFAVIPMRSGGRPLSRGELANRAPRIGDLRIEEMRDELLMRYVRTARLLQLGRAHAPRVLIELFEPVIVAMSPAAFTLSGFERTSDRSYAQSWLVRNVADAQRQLGTGRGLHPVRRYSDSLHPDDQ